MITADAILSALELYLFAKKSGIVAESMCCVITRVLLPRMFHASREPIKAFPKPIHVDARPNLQPN